MYINFSCVGHINYTVHIYSHISIYSQVMKKFVFALRAFFLHESTDQTFSTYVKAIKWKATLIYNSSNKDSSNFFGIYSTLRSTWHNTNIRYLRSYDWGNLKKALPTLGPSCTVSLLPSSIMKNNCNLQKRV